MSTTLVHLSDLHFGTEIPGAVRALKQAVARLEPDLVVVSGDLTQRARKQQFDNARRFLDALDVCCLVVPGNHDIPLFNWYARLTNPFGRYRQHFGSRLNFAVTHRLVTVLGVSSVRPRRHQSGAVAETRRQWIRAELDRQRQLHDDAPGRITVVVCHHPLASPGYDESAVRADRGAGLAAEWSGLGVDFVLSGHIHRPFLLEGPAHHASNGRRLWHLGAGTALSNRLRQQIPNSFNLIRSSNDDGHPLVEIEQFDLTEGEADFVCVGQQVVDVEAGLVRLPERLESPVTAVGPHVIKGVSQDRTDSLWQNAESNWDSFRGRVKEQWGYLTDDHLMQIAGRREQLIANLQRLYGISQERAEQEVDAWGLQNRLADAGRHDDRQEPRTEK